MYYLFFTSVAVKRTDTALKLTQSGFDTSCLMLAPITMD